MKRSELIRIVKRSASLAALPEDITDRLVAAVSNPRVTSVARGTWRTENCNCPMELAGLHDAIGWNDARLAAAVPGPGPGSTFTYWFDSLTEGSSDPRIIDIEEDAA